MIISFGPKEFSGAKDSLIGKVMRWGGIKSQGLKQGPRRAERGETGLSHTLSKRFSKIDRK